MPDAPAPDREQRREEMKRRIDYLYSEFRHPVALQAAMADAGWLLAELARVEQGRDRLRELALAVVDTEGCCTGKILDAMDRLRAILGETARG